jgi:hypothetical protein
MAADRPGPGFGILWVPIVMALLAAAIVTLRGCHHEGGPATAPAMETSARVRE